MLSFIKDVFCQNDIMDPPYNYAFLKMLPESEYPKYLKKIFKYTTGDDLNLRNPKTFNEKIQWLKLYDSTPLKSKLSDKVLVRDWVKEKISEDYLKPVLQICKSYDELDFDSFPQSFVIKANHGCKWNFIIKNKEEYLRGTALPEYAKEKITNWLNQTFTFWAGFELQYENIEPQLIVEPYMSDDITKKPQEIEVFCFNGVPAYAQKILTPSTEQFSEVCIYDENLNEQQIQFNLGVTNVSVPADDNVKLAMELSAKLAKDFKFVRVDWMIYNDKIYFNEMTFTPMSGFGKMDKQLNRRLGDMLDLHKK